MNRIIFISFLSSGNEVEILGVFVQRMSQTSQWHVPGSVPSDCFLLWSENNLVGSQWGSFWGESQKSWLWNFPESGFAEFIIVVGDDLDAGVVKGSVVPDVLGSPNIRDGWDDSIQAQWEGVGFGHFSDEDEHEEATGVEVSDGDLDRKEGTSLRSKYPPR